MARDLRSQALRQIRIRAIHREVEPERSGAMLLLHLRGEPLRPIDGSALAFMFDKPLNSGHLLDMKGRQNAKPLKLLALPSGMLSPP